MRSPIVELANSKENRKSLFPDIFTFPPALRDPPLITEGWGWGWGWGGRESRGHKLIFCSTREVGGGGGGLNKKKWWIGRSSNYLYYDTKPDFITTIKKKYNCNKTAIKLIYHNK